MRLQLTCVKEKINNLRGDMMTGKIKKNFHEIYKIITSKEMSILPANIAFYFVLALIPIITITIVVASYFNVTIDLVIELINNVIPSPVANTIIDVISGKGFDSNVGFFNIVALVIASNGTHAIINASNTLYHVEDSNFFKDRLRAIFILIIIVFLFVFIIIVPVLGDKILNMIKDFELLSNIINTIITIFNYIKWPLTFIILYINIKLIYTISPSRDIGRRDTTYGAFFTSIIWMVVSAIFGYYLKYFANYDIIYGNLSSLIILIMWIYILSYVFVLGIAINVTRLNNKDK